MAANRQIETLYTQPRRVENNSTRRAPGWVWPPASMALGVALWEVVVRVGRYPDYLLPGPQDVAVRFGQALADGTWLRHTQVTLVESVLGFLAGFVVAVVLGYTLARQRSLERALSPYIAASQSLPIVAIAPLVVLWFGYGFFPKVLVCALVVFFPILVNTLVGIRNIPRDMLEVAQVYGANRWQTLWMVEAPLALPVLLAGVRLGLTLSITGAVVAEFVGADVGLGVLLNISSGLFDTPLMFVALVTLIAMASSFYALAVALERALLGWQETRK